MKIETPAGSSGTVVALEGHFGTAEADRLHAALQQLAPDRPLTIDFRAVRVFHDSAVVRIATDLASGHGMHVNVLGLSEHHWRLLRYFGLDPLAASEPAPSEV
jgi:hypothetical protein